MLVGVSVFVGVLVGVFVFVGVFVGVSVLVGVLVGVFVFVGVFVGVGVGVLVNGSGHSIQYCQGIPSKKGAYTSTTTYVGSLFSLLNEYFFTFNETTTLFKSNGVFVPGIVF